MFDIGFSELLVVFVVALIILGPERLPTAAKTAGLWIRKIRRSINSVQREINAQLDKEELDRKIEQTNQRILQESKDIQNTIMPTEASLLDKAAKPVEQRPINGEVDPALKQGDINAAHSLDHHSLDHAASDTSTLADETASTKENNSLAQDDLSAKKTSESQSSRP